MPRRFPRLRAIARIALGLVAAESFGVARKTWGRRETGERCPEAAVVERIKAG